ncbi:hypothetical protein C8R46DRAFT_47859 [Mycena filopes]|nr:hypothetical protein C8R46DRAFT_47859 [Mycena filopes]
MRLPLLARGKPRVKLKATPAHTSETVGDVIETSLGVVKESADAFPPLKAVVGGMMATLDIRKRVKRSKAEADKISARTQTISAGIAQPVPLQRSIGDFNVHLTDIRSSVEPIARSNTILRLLHLNHNERTLTDRGGPAHRGAHRSSGRFSVARGG